LPSSMPSVVPEPAIDLSTLQPRPATPRRSRWQAGVKRSTNKEQADGSTKEEIDSVRTLNTSTYLVINARALRRIRGRNADLLTIQVRMVA
jgi:hypothetical protein